MANLTDPVARLIRKLAIVPTLVRKPIYTGCYLMLCTFFKSDAWFLSWKFHINVYRRILSFRYRGLRLIYFFDFYQKFFALWCEIRWGRKEECLLTKLPITMVWFSRIQQIQSRFKRKGVLIKTKYLIWNNDFCRLR